jgi:NO-binding membrane sensor protein with MHYT domain
MLRHGLHRRSREGKRMNEWAGAGGESSLLLWSLAALVAALAGHVGLGWVRQAQRRALQGLPWAELLRGAVALGTGLCAAVVLALLAEGLKFDIGYRAILVPLLWLGAVAGSLPLVAWLAWRQRALALLAAGLALALLLGSLQLGWINAAGFRPGPQWHAQYTTAAALLEIIGCTVVVWMACAPVVNDSPRRALWQTGAALALALTLVAGQLLLDIAGGLLLQTSSVYLPEVPGSVLSLVCGVLVPLGGVVMALELALRQRSSRRRRKRRHKRRPRTGSSSAAQ